MPDLWDTNPDNVFKTAGEQPSPTASGHDHPKQVARATSLAKQDGRCLFLLSTDQSGPGVFRPGVIMTSGPMGDDEGLLTEKEAAAILQLSLSAVRKLRLAGSGPPYVMIGRQTRYRQAVVQGWLAGEGQHSSAADNR